MKFLNNVKIGLRLNIVLSVTMLLIITALGLYVLNIQEKKILADTDLRMYEQVEDLSIIVDAKPIGDTVSYHKFLKKIFNSKKYFDSGYPFMVDKKGTFIIHPTKEGQNFYNAEFFQQLISSRKKVGKTFYMWDGRQKFQYFKFNEKMQAYISASIYEDELMGIINQMRISILIAVLLGGFLFTMLIMTISRSITKSLNKGVELAESIANGDLSKTIDINQKDEVGQLAEALNRMVIKIKEIVGDVMRAAEGIASASQQMSANSQQVSQGASEQASSAEEVSSSMEEMSSNIQQNTDNSQQTEKISAKAAIDILEGSKNVNITVESMKNIAEKVSLIGDIASQTNILALNAAVEAARAGEHGKGFAVVAAEVRKLAERSQKAATEINEVSKDSVEIAEKSGELLNAIVPDIQKTSKLVEEITAASLEQNSGADQINNAINQLNQVTQQNAAAAEQMATSSEELSSQADQLRQMMAFFNIGDNKNKIKTKLTHNKKTEKKINNESSVKKEIVKAESDKGFTFDMTSNDKIDNDYEEF